MTSTHCNPNDQQLVDLVLPVYNEAHVLEASVGKLATAMTDRANFPWRIVIVDNGSTDETATIGERLAEQSDAVGFLRLEEKGRGRALRAAWNETDAAYSLYMDIDLSTGLDAVATVVAALQDGADVVTGSRLHRKSQITRCFKREILSRGYNCLIRWLLHTRTFDDAQCGFKGVRLETVRPLLGLIENQEWFFDTELLVLAEYAGLTVKSLPITWLEDLDSRVNIPATIREDLHGLARLRRTGRTLAGQYAKP